MTKFVRPLMFVLIAMSLVLAACGGSVTTTQAPPAVEPTTAPAEITTTPAEPTEAQAQDPLAMYAPDTQPASIPLTGQALRRPSVVRSQSISVSWVK